MEAIKNEVFKVGDEVYHVHIGKGIVTNIDHHYMVGVKFKHGLQYVNMYDLSFREIDSRDWHVRPKDLSLSSTRSVSNTAHKPQINKTMKVTHALVHKISYGRWKIFVDLLIRDVKVYNLSFETTDSESIDTYQELKSENYSESNDFIEDQFEYAIESKLKELIDYV